MIDVAFDCHQDAKGGDPDSHSPTLRRSHQLLWQKPLPSGKTFNLDISGRKPFIVHQSEIGDFQMTSDLITHTYAGRPTIKPFISELPIEQRSFIASRGWLVSECIIFPGKRVNKMNTINGARGMSRQIGDRFDLSLECIRRHYRKQDSPLSQVLDRYASFFALFETFDGYVDFFLLQDLVSEDNREAVKFYIPFDNFHSKPLPQDLESYTQYLSGVQNFATGRAQRMIEWVQNRDLTAP